MSPYGGDGYFPTAKSWRARFAGHLRIGALFTLFLSCECPHDEDNPKNHNRKQQNGLDSGEISIGIDLVIVTNHALSTVYQNGVKIGDG